MLVLKEETTAACTTNNPQYEALAIALKALRKRKSPLIEGLHRAQEIFGYLPPEVQRFVAQHLHIPLSQVHGVVTFYNYFRTEAVAKHLINICTGTACHVKGAEDLLTALAKELGVRAGGTTEDKMFTLSTARCFGCCGLAPVMMVGEDVFGKLTGEKAVQVIREIREKDAEER